MLIVRNNFADTYTEGQLYSAKLARAVYTLEQEWRASAEHQGGMNGNSCVPNGTYMLLPFKRPSGKEVLLLHNAALDVFMYEQDAAGGRFLIEIHIGNKPEHSKGCILPGLRREPRRVWDSALAMQLVLEAFKSGDKQLTIRSFDTDTEI